MQSQRQKRLWKRLPVVSSGEGRTLIEIGNTLKNFTLFSMEPAYYDMKISMRLKERDRISDVKGKKDCLLMRISRTYKNMAMPMPGKSVPSYEGNWETGVCVSLMPKNPISVKRGDGKSYFEISKSVLATDGTLTRLPVIKRWRLEIRPEDRERYRRGELVEPVNPIIFYIDRNFPKMYRKSIIEAVREWRPAFEQAESKAWRRIKYFRNTTNDFTFGKDIRIFNFRDRILRNARRSQLLQHFDYFGTIFDVAFDVKMILILFNSTSSMFLV